MAGRVGRGFLRCLFHAAAAAADNAHNDDDHHDNGAHGDRYGSRDSQGQDFIEETAS